MPVLPYAGAGARAEWNRASKERRRKLRLLLVGTVVAAAVMLAVSSRPAFTSVATNAVVPSVAVAGLRDGNSNGSSTGATGSSSSSSSSTGGGGVTAAVGFTDVRDTGAEHGEEGGEKQDGPGSSQAMIAQREETVDGEEYTVGQEEGEHGEEGEQGVKGETLMEGGEIKDGQQAVKEVEAAPVGGGSDEKTNEEGGNTGESGGLVEDQEGQTAGVITGGTGEEESVQAGKGEVEAHGEAAEQAFNEQEEHGSRASGE